MDASYCKGNASEESTEEPVDTRQKCPTYEEALKLLDSALEAKREMRRRIHRLREQLSGLEPVVG